MLQCYFLISAMLCYPTGGGPLNIDFGSIAIPGSSGARPAAARSQPPRSPQEAMEDPKSVRDILLASPHELSILKERNPELADALLSGSLGMNLPF